MIDVHCHLNFHKFEEDYDDVIQRALKKGVTRIINTGTKLDSSRQAIGLSEKYQELYAIVGVHPHHADKLTEGHPEPFEVSQGKLGEGSHESQSRDSSASPQNDTLPNDWIEQLEQMTKHSKVVGIGECGMDFYEYQSNGIVDPEVQEEVFESQIELAHRAGLPLQIHNRQAGEKVIEILRHHKNSLLPVPGMFHCFAGSEQVMRDALDLGFYIGFDGNVTYKGIAKGETTDLKALAKLVPLDRLVVETDSPYLTPHPHRGERNEPAYVIIVAEFLAELKDVSYQTVVEQTDKNVYTIFSKLN
jgi:TatD DNase family protein